MTDLVIHGQRILTPEGVRPACVHVRSGKIEAVTDLDVVPPTSLFVNAGDNLVMPGIIDTHVHVASWEGFSAATRVAAAAGVTTLFDMPMDSLPATTRLAALHEKRAAALGHTMVNVGFIGGVVPGNAGDLAGLHDAGISLFKCFLAPSGNDEFPEVTEADLRVALPILAALDATLLVHAELPRHLLPPLGDPRQYANYLASRPEVAESEAVALMIRLSEEFGARVHIGHVSSATTIPLLHDARARGVKITSETCPHYLSFEAEQIPDGETQFKCTPPIRAAHTRDGLWRALLAGDIDQIVSDHSPGAPEHAAEQSGDFFQATGGIASLRFGLSAVWHEARAHGATVQDVSRWMSAAPAALAGLAHRKGRLASGFDADVVIWDTEAQVSVDDMTLSFPHPTNPYFRRSLTGAVRTTFVGGMEVFRDGLMGAGAPGRLI